MTPSTLRLRSIHDLLRERFFVPSYQRGYRWEPKQVEALLDDLAAFQKANRQSSNETYYCLQPVVVVRDRPESAWELVDGQQRLTTICLILVALREIAEVFKRRPFTISYASRPGSENFLMRPTQEGTSEYIDYQYMYEAHEAIRRWAADQDGRVPYEVVNCLTAPDGEVPNVRVIWYELDSTQVPLQAFVRLNVGRILLTSAELIRAQLLRSDRDLDPRDAQQLPQDWDLIERQLQNDRYWYFLQSNKSPPPARIEYLFDIFVRTKQESSTQLMDTDPLATFLEFQRLLESKDTQAWTLWQEFKKLAQTLEDWYEDPTLYHLIGFLVETATMDKRSSDPPRHAESGVLLELLKLRNAHTGRDFDRHLRRLAWKRFAGHRGIELPQGNLSEENLRQLVAQRIGDLAYGKRAVRTALLLFNIAELLNQSAPAQWFQFDSYKTNEWDIEHVHSVAEYVPGSPADRRQWLERADDFVNSSAAVTQDRGEAEALQREIANLLKKVSPDGQCFQDVFMRVRKLSGEEDRDDDDSLSNLALLDMGTNRSYRNAIFPIKRARIIDLDKKGQFVPPATRNVFLKYYSPNASQLLLWDGADQDCYARAMEETLYRFFEPLVKRSSGQ